MSIFSGSLASLVGSGVSGAAVGCVVGEAVGFVLGEAVGSVLGDAVGCSVGSAVGGVVGGAVGSSLGGAGGSSLGEEEGSVEAVGSGSSPSAIASTGVNASIRAKIHKKALCFILVIVYSPISIKIVVHSVRTSIIFEDSTNLLFGGK